MNLKGNPFFYCDEHDKLLPLDETLRMTIVCWVAEFFGESPAEVSERSAYTTGLALDRYNIPMPEEAYEPEEG